MEERKRQKFRLRRPEGSAYDVRTRASRLRATSLAVNRSGHGYSSCMVKTPLVFLCVCVIWHQISLDLPSVNAFSVFRPESITPTLPSLSSSRPEASPTCLFLFSLRNDNNEGEEPGSENDDGSTATIERAAGWNAEEESEDFSAWMEGLRKGTPLGKMASQAAVENKDASDPKIIRSSSTKKEVVNSVSLRERKQDRSVSMDNNTGRRKINPLSNLIQFEAMLELAKIAGNKDTKIDMDADGTIANSNSTSATDVFAVVDRLVKTFQKQEENRQTEGKELLQLAQLEETIAKEQEEIEANPEDVSATTTVKDLMELDRYVGGIEFPKVSNIWDSFGSKTEEAVTTEEDEQVGGNDKNSIPSPTGSASSSPLFRGNELSDADAASSPSNLARAAESILKDTTNKMEYLVAEASSSTLEPSDGNNSSSSSTSALQDLVGRASSVFNNTSASTASATTGTIVESISNDIVSAAQKIAKESGVDINVQFAADRAREATEYAIGVTTTANMILDAGYAYGSRSGAAGMSIRDDNFNYLAASAATQTAGSVFSDGSSSSTAEAPAHQPPLFGDFASAQRIEPHEYENVVFQGADMGVLAGAIYENAAHRCHKLGHSLVANGTTADVAWMVTDSVMDRERFKAAFRHHDDAIDSNEDESEDASSSGPVMVRTITMRGFDASDESVDREALLNEICFATSVPMDEATADKVVFHKGLLEIARQIYSETKKYIDWTSPNHKIILNGHSVGGSLSVLMLLLIASERGSDYVRDRILRVYSHGSPPVATLANTTFAQSYTNEKFSGTQRCRVLEAFDLPASMVYGFIQPYDPVVRLFSDHDVLYPLVDDLGKDGITLYSSGPIRSLRPITRAIFQAWDGWPQFRDNWKGTCDMQYQSVGIQHLLLPEPLRYLNDRFISVNVGVPPVDAIVRISPEDLLPALDLTFPLDTFQVSLVPQAVRSFLHHFFPAYDTSITDFAAKVKYQAKMDEAKKNGSFKTLKTKQS